MFALLVCLHCPGVAFGLQESVCRRCLWTPLFLHCALTRDEARIPRFHPATAVSDEAFFGARNHLLEPPEAELLWPGEELVAGSNCRTRVLKVTQLVLSHNAKFLWDGCLNALQLILGFPSSSCLRGGRHLEARNSCERAFAQPV